MSIKNENGKLPKLKIGSMILFLSAFLNQMCLSITLISLPILAYTIGSSSFLIGVLGAVGGLVYALMAYMIGSISERFSRKNLFLVAEIIQALSMLLCIFSENIYHLIFARLIFSIGTAMFWPSVESSIADLTTSRDELYGNLMRFNVSWSTGAIIGPQIGGLMITWFFIRTPFLLSMSVFLLISIVFFFGTMHMEVSRNTPSLKNVRSIVRSKRENLNILPLSYMLLFGFTNAVLSSIFPAYATNLGIPAESIGLMFLLAGLTQTLIFFSAGELQSRIGERRILLLSSGLFFGSLAMIGLVLKIELFLLGFAIFGVAQGLAYSMAILLILKEVGSRGKAAAAFESTLGIGSFIGPLLGGVLYTIGDGYPYFLAAFLSLSIALAQILKGSR